MPLVAAFLFHASLAITSNATMMLALATSFIIIKIPPSAPPTTRPLLTKDAKTLACHSTTAALVPTLRAVSQTGSVQQERIPTRMDMEMAGMAMITAPLVRSARISIMTA